MIEFTTFPKIARLSRDIVITEKIDGTNGQIAIFDSRDLNEETLSSVKTLAVGCKHLDDYSWFMLAGSRSRWLTLDNDNFNFAKWVHANQDNLFSLGVGRHFGEWWGNGIQRGYGLPSGDKRFSLFNVAKWSDDLKRPRGCEVVPVLYEGIFDTNSIHTVMAYLKMCGSRVVPGFMNPEGIVIYHKASGQLFKKTIENDEAPKSAVEGVAA